MRKKKKKNTNTEVEIMTHSSVNAAGRFADGSADKRNGLFRESLISSSTFSVIVAENNMVCLLLEHNFT